MKPAPPLTSIRFEVCIEGPTKLEILPGCMARNDAFRKAIEEVNGTIGRDFWPLLRTGEVLGRAALSRSKTR
jgi:hypothetical protein